MALTLKEQTFRSDVAQNVILSKELLLEVSSTRKADGVECSSWNEP